MKCSLSRTVLFSLLSALAFPMAYGQADGDTSARESARRKAALRDAMQQVEEARHAYTDKKYSDAVEHYRNALAVIPNAPATEKQRTFIKDSLSDALIAKAMDYRTVGRYDEAVSFLKEAISLSPKNERARSELVRTQDPVRHNPALTPKHVGNVEEVERLLTQAYGELDLGNYDKAMETFRAVSQYDSYNEAAMRGMEAVQKRRSAFFADAHDAARAEALAEVDSKWVSESVTAAAEAAQLPGAAPAVADALPETAEVEARIAAALQNMVLPQITFEDAGVMDVIEALQGQIRRFEQNGTEAGRPINITTSFGATDSEGFKRIMAKTLRLNLSNVSMRDVLDRVSKQLGITYYITSIGVDLSYSGRDFGPMTERIYSVAPHFFDMQEDKEEDDDDDDFSSKSSSAGLRVRRVNPVTALKAMGVSFPEGSSARYDAATRQLRVINTAYNQEEIAGLVNMPLDSTGRAVVLNVMAMEVSETDLNSLGFEWLVNFDLMPHPLFIGGAVTRELGLQQPEGAATPATSRSMTEGLRSTAALAASNNNVDKLISMGGANKYNEAMANGGKAPGVFSLRGVWDVGDVTVIMRGLVQKKGTDILYNPRLVLTPGMEEQVTFANVREMFYPESYSAPQVTSSNITLGHNKVTDRDINGYSTMAQAAHPEEFTRFGMSEDGVGGIGSVLQVHQAEVAQDGQHVTLALTVTVNDFEGFVNWGTPIKSFLMTDDGTVPITEILLTDNKILKPVFKRHMENTKITVAPGNVVVMGGLQEAQTVRFEDKLPILGDLPLVGRLFRSQGEERVRKAFLLFAKVDLVDPSGKDPRSGERPSDKSEL